MSRAALIIEVVAGVIPNEPMPEHTKRWSMTGEETQELASWNRIHGEALLYMVGLQNPPLANWVRMDWVWL